MANTDGPWVRFFASDWLAGTRGMTAAETGVYITLIATMYERAEPLVRDDARLARLCGLPARNFTQILDRLIDDQKITVEGEKLWGRKVEYEVRNRSARAERGRTAANAKHEQKQSPKPASAERKQPPSSARSVPYARATPEPEPELEGFSNENPKKQSPSAPSRLEQESWWLEFWDVFPNKVGKADAGKAFIKAIKRTDRETMMAGLDRYVNKDDDRPWCNPSTWLNQDRWADQPAQVARQQQSRRVSEGDILMEAARRMDNGDFEQTHDGAGPTYEQHAVTGPRR